jgi:hypothetical protein
MMCYVHQSKLVSAPRDVARCAAQASRYEERGVRLPIQQALKSLEGADTHQKWVTYQRSLTRRVSKGSRTAVLANTQSQLA